MRVSELDAFLAESDDGLRERIAKRLRLLEDLVDDGTESAQELPSVWRDRLDEVRRSGDRVTQKRPQLTTREGLQLYALEAELLHLELRLAFHYYRKGVDEIAALPEAEYS